MPHIRKASLFFLILTSLSLSACGGSSSDTKEPAAPEEETPNQEQKLTHWNEGNWNELNWQ